MPRPTQQQMDAFNKNAEENKKNYQNADNVEKQKKNALSKGSLLQAKTLKRAGASEAKETKRQKAIEALVKHAEGVRQAGYDSWLSAMGEVLFMAGLMVPINPLGMLVNWAAETAAKGIEFATGLNMRPGHIVDIISTEIESKFSEEKKKLPGLIHFVEFTDQNTLKIDSLGKNLRRADGQALSPALEAEFAKTLKQGVDIWLGNHGYVPDPNHANAGQYFDVHSNVLTKDDFDNLRNDPNTGLSAFLSNAYDMDLIQAAGPRSTPSP